MFHRLHKAISYFIVVCHNFCANKVTLVKRIIRSICDLILIVYVCLNYDEFDQYMWIVIINQLYTEVFKVNCLRVISSETCFAVVYTSDIDK